ncbi:MAG TPA: hypothetical protein VD995_19005 [Azospirillum sp.]|nr:hypothetical protein [Azospirillum sp.]
MRASLFFAATLATVLLPEALLASPDSGAAAGQQQTFVVEAALANVFEKETARLAASKADTTPERVPLAPFAERMLSEHESL